MILNLFLVLHNGTVLNTTCLRLYMNNEDCERNAIETNTSVKRKAFTLWGCQNIERKRKLAQWSQNELKLETNVSLAKPLVFAWENQTKPLTSYGKWKNETKALQILLWMFDCMLYLYRINYRSCDADLWRKSFDYSFIKSHTVGIYQNDYTT